MKQISIKEVLDHLSNGVTRTVDSAGYVTEVGSIEEKYDLTKAEIKEMFTHPLLKNKKTKPPKSFTLIDDLTAKETTSTEKSPSYGARPISSPSSGEVEVELPTAASMAQETVSEEVTAQAEPELTQDDLA